MVEIRKVTLLREEAFGEMGHAAKHPVVRAVALVAMSTTNGGRPSRGAPNASGLVPSIAVRPPQGATSGDEFENPSDTRPSRARRSRPLTRAAQRAASGTQPRWLASMSMRE